MTAWTRLPHRELEARLDAIGWGLLFLVTGGLLLVPDAPDGGWLIGVGAVLLAMTAARAVLRLSISWFVGIVGIVALGTGVGQLGGIDVPLVAVSLIICGGALVVAELVRSPGTTTG